MSAKKLLSGLVLLFVVAFGAYATGQKESTKSTSSTATASNAQPIVFTAGGSGPDPAFFTEMLSKLKSPKAVFHPLSGTSNNQVSYYIERLAAGSSTPDIMNMDIGWPAQFYSAGWLLPVDKYVPKSELDKFVPAYVHALTVQGHLVAFPGQADSLLLYYRTDLLKKYGFNGPPKTWAELVHQAQVILKGENNPNLSGFLWQGANIEGLLENYLEFLWGMGGSILNSEGKVAINRPKNVEALQLMIDMFQKYHVSPPGITTMATDPSRVAFEDGRAIFLLNWNYCWSQFQSKDSAVKGEVGQALPPTSGPQYSSHVALGGWQLAINKYTKDPQAAIKVAEYMSSTEFQTQRILQISELPTRLDVYTNPTVDNQVPWLPGYLSIIQSGKNRPRSPEYNEVSKAIRDELSAALAGIKTPQQAMNDAQAALQKLTILPE